MTAEAKARRCPKCGRGRADGAAACPRCGLTFALWRDDSAAEARGLDPTGESLWTALTATWTDPTAHDGFVKHCAQNGRLAAAGRAYRGYLDAHPGDPVATQMQSRIVGMATAVLLPTQSARVPVTRSNWFLWVIGIGALLGILAGLFFQNISS